MQKNLRIWKLFCNFARYFRFSMPVDGLFVVCAQRVCE